MKLLINYKCNHFACYKKLRTVPHEAIYAELLKLTEEDVTNFMANFASYLEIRYEYVTKLGKFILMEMR
jgi:hypothetical protein